CRYPSSPCPPLPLVPLSVLPVPLFALSAAIHPHRARLSPRCHHAGPALRVPARLQDCQVLADAEPAGGAVAPAAAAERAWLHAGSPPHIRRWVLLLRKGYQERDTAPRVAVVTKVKGAAVAEAAGRRLWDAADLTWPPQGENVLFLVTHFIATIQQAQGTCPEGGSIRVLIEWNCDLDHPATQCQPHYSFSLQDMRYNFRTASYYWGSQQQLYRNLLKLYGIRFDLSVHGQAGKFSIVPTAVSFGTSIAFFGAATMVCDLVLLYLDAKADLYWKEKFEEAKPPKGKPKATA
uniref:Uncharacterized protein n=1 Tax=Geospiza parvula TaxID=87175 RepID=A0A8C3QBH3_GEOPR